MNSHTDRRACPDSAIVPACSATSTPPPLPSAARPLLIWGRDALKEAARSGTSWLWHGYLARGGVTLLTSQWKSGKTTLAAILLSRLKTGGQLAGLPVTAGQAVVVSEEPPEQWTRRSDHLDFGNHVGWFCRPFKAKPRPGQWLDFIDQLADLHAQRGIDLVVIDPLAAFMSGSENDAACMLQALMPLQRLTTAGLSVLVSHHPRKGKFLAGQAARGSSALSAYADILIEMRCYRRAADNDRRRKLQAFSRYPETPRRLVIELNADGTDYVCLGSFEEQEFADSWHLLRAVLEQAPHKLTRRDIGKDWPAAKPPEDTTLYRWLERALAQGLVCKDGTGVRNSPFRYWLPEREPVWRQDPLAFLHMPELFQ